MINLNKLIILFFLFAPLPAFARIIATDNFNRADGGLGANWTTANSKEDPAIVSNQVQDSSNTGTTNAGAFWSANTWPDDQYSQIQIVAALNNNNNRAGLLLRQASGANTFYDFLIRGPLGATANFQLLKTVAGSTTLLSSGTVTFNANSYARAEVRGRDLAFYIDGILQSSLSVSDTAIANGSAGFQVRVENGGALSNAIVDNWEGGDFVTRIFMMGKAVIGGSNPDTVGGGITTFMEPGTDATEGFEFYSASTGAFTSDNTVFNTGPRSIKLSTAAGPTLAGVTSPTGVVVDTGAQISFYFRYDTLPAAQVNILNVMQSGGSNVLSVRLNTSGNLEILPVGLSAVAGPTVLSVNTWYHISVSYYITDQTIFTMKVYLNGVLETFATNTGTMTRITSSKVQFLVGGAAGTNRTVWFDDIYIATGGASSTSQPDTGDIRVTAKRPNANGTLNEYTTQIGSGGSGYGTGHSPQVNERPLSTSNGWSIQNAAKKTEEYNIESISGGDVDISNFRIVDYMGWAYTQVGSASTGNIILNGSATNISVTTSYSMFTKAAGSGTYPPNTGAVIGVDTNTVNQLFSLAECGVLFAFAPYTGGWGQVIIP